MGIELVLVRKAAFECFETKSEPLPALAARHFQGALTWASRMKLLLTPRACMSAAEDSRFPMKYVSSSVLPASAMLKPCMTV